MADGDEHSEGLEVPIVVLSTQEERASAAPALASAPDEHRVASTDMHRSAGSEGIHSASTLAIVPHSTPPYSPGPTRPVGPGMHRPSPFPQPTVADLFSAIHRLEEVAHTLTVNQRGMALQLGNLSTTMAELQRHVSTLEHRITRQRESSRMNWTPTHTVRTLEYQACKAP